MHGRVLVAFGALLLVLAARALSAADATSKPPRTVVDLEVPEPLPISEVVDRMFRAAGLKYRFEDGLALPDRRMSVSLKQGTIEQAIDLVVVGAFRGLPDRPLGMVYAREGDTFVFRKRPIERGRVRLPLDAPDLGSVRKVGPFSVKVTALERSPGSLTLAYECEGPRALAGPLAENHPSTHPQLELRSGKLATLMVRQCELRPARGTPGEADRVRYVVHYFGVRREEDPQDPPVAVLFDVVWWKS